ncbi:MAG: AraC family transcriptional regulator [Spirochaetes bacterium]|nr:AraC family transcriptional regulator [Spirochaetota bacterium]MBU1081884.1 AraC family transcriptional regulator [Spirochaetota bacterium]
MIDHVKIIEEAVSWIYEHPDERPSARDVADRAAYSVDHFGRIFKAVAGEALGEFLLRQRLERAASRLLKSPGMSVTDIAAEAGYSSSNFSVAFKRRYGASPSAYRADPASVAREEHRAVLSRIAATRTGAAAAARLESVCSVRTVPAMTLYRERFRGPYADLRPAWHSFCIRVAAKFPGTEPLFVGISRDDPLTSDPARSSYDLCVAVPEGRGPGYLRLPERVCAVYAFDAPVADMIYGFNELVAIWMPRHGLTLGDGPSLEIYRSAGRPDGTIACEICVPARG